MAEGPVYLKFEGVPVVTFYVGPDLAVFHIHQNILFDASPVFKAAFCGDFQEAFERSMPLPDDDKDSVGRMISWLYFKKFELSDPLTEDESQECYMQLAKLNTVADKYDIYLLKNHIVDHLFDLAKISGGINPPQIPVVAYVYNNTTKGSSFRKLMVAWYAFKIDLDYYDVETTRDELAGASQEFAIDLVMELGALQAHPDRCSPFTLPASVFYEIPPKEVDEKEASQTSN